MVIWLLTLVILTKDTPLVEADDDVIFIRTDGSIEPLTAPLRREGSIYTLTASTESRLEVLMDDIVIDPEYFDCTVPAGQTFVHRTNPDYTAFIYVIDGVGKIGGEALENGTLVLFDEGDQLTVSAAGEPLRFLLLTGKPLNEPVAWRGPIVMNTQAELELAFREYREGTFIKNK